MSFAQRNASAVDQRASNAVQLQRSPGAGSDRFGKFIRIHNIDYTEKRNKPLLDSGLDTEVNVYSTHEKTRQIGHAEEKTIK